MQQENQITFQNFNQPANVDHLANQIRQHVSARRLTANIGGKDYPMVEAWQYAGALVGLFPRVVSCDDISKNGEYKYRAEVEIIDSRNGEVISRAFAFCSNKEKKKQYFDEYAIASMAQTRAVGKAFRVLLAWILQASGYEATPAEEMDTVVAESDVNEVLHNEYRDILISSFGLCTDLLQLTELYKAAKLLKRDKKVIEASKAAAARIKEQESE
jgi:hypothetical protein